MAWQINLPWSIDLPDSRSTRGAFGVNDTCFIRKEHKCGKIFGASKACFIACPTQDDLETILNLMAEKLTKFGIEPVVAVKERAYGQDIFCTKICGRIIESRFCIVILDDTIIEGQNIPNPNVYYEYGLMTSLGKHIIPLQKDGLRLAFNIQSYDTIKYTPKNIALELDRAIRDAISITDSPDRPPSLLFPSDKTIFRQLEMAGLQQKDDAWVLASAIADTGFRGFGQYDNRFYLYLGRIDTDADLAPYLDDLAVTVYRTEKKARELQMEAAMLHEQMSLDTKSLDNPTPGSAEVLSLHRRRLSDAIASARRKIADLSSKIDLMSTMYVGFVVNPDVDIKAFFDKAKAILRPYERYKLATNETDAIKFGDLRISLTDLSH